MGPCNSVKSPIQSISKKNSNRSASDFNKFKRSYTNKYYTNLLPDNKSINVNLESKKPMMFITLILTLKSKK